MINKNFLEVRFICKLYFVHNTEFKDTLEKYINNWFYKLVILTKYKDKLLNMTYNDLFYEDNYEKSFIQVSKNKKPVFETQFNEFGSELDNNIFKNIINNHPTALTVMTKNNIILDSINLYFFKIKKYTDNE